MPGAVLDAGRTVGDETDNRPALTAHYGGRTGHRANDPEVGANTVVEVLQMAEAGCPGAVCGGS